VSQLAETLAQTIDPPHERVRLHPMRWMWWWVPFGLCLGGEWWLRRRTMSRAAVSSYLSSFVWNALEGVARENGVRIDTQGRLRLVNSGRNA